MSSSSSSSSSSSTPHPVGTRLAKNFPGYGLFFGEVTAYDSESDLYEITYGDGDQETMERSDLEEALQFYQKKKAMDFFKGFKTKKKSSETSPEAKPSASASKDKNKKKGLAAASSNKNEDKKNKSKDFFSGAKAKKKTPTPSVAAAAAAMDEDEEEKKDDNDFATPSTNRRRATGSTSASSRAAAAASSSTPHQQTLEAAFSSKSRSGRTTSSAKRSYNEDEMFDDYELDELDADIDADLAGGAAAAAAAAASNKSKKKSTGGNKKAKTAKTSAAGGTKRRRKSDDDSFSAFEEDDDDDDDDDMELEEDDFDYDEDEEDRKPAAKPKKKKSKTKKGAAAAKKKTKTSTKKKKKKNDESESEEELDFEALVAKDAFKPKNNPQAFVEPFCEAVGIDPTDGIVEGLVNGQVKKIGGLLVAAINSGDMTPIKLQTACSGTDAPAIALALVKEQMDKIYGAGNHPFQYAHRFSCEVEPFKQGYLSRNFPNVPLFPDIVKLTDGDEVADVYGVKQPIPEGNLFVAGTSCKDFSGLRRNGRKDIEDKGQSGLTFMAAVEFLEKFGPEMAIFENVDGAPWDKMQEYITGRAPLASIYNMGKVTNSGAKKSDAKELTFSVSAEDGYRYRVEAVPRQVGVPAGSLVDGFVQGCDDEGNLIEIKGDEDDVDVELTLSELVEKHDLDMEEDTLVFAKQNRYCTHLVALTTKHYGLPQTRQRKYLFVWKSDDPNDDLGEYFEEILDFLKEPIVHSIEAFFLPPSHDRIRQFREALRSGPGQLLARDRAREPDFWDWKNKNKDTPRHVRFRRDNGIDELSRWFTGWGTSNHLECAPNLMPELLDAWNGRRLDMIECFGAAAMRDVTARDANHHLFTWDISQNVTRTNFRDADVGVTGCITPGGEIIVPHLGRSLMGYEKLLMQGIPFSRLKLGNETEVQLSDLAGNAMSLPVVCAAELAAITCKQLRREKMANSKYVLKNARLANKYDSTKGRVLAERGDLFGTTQPTNGTDAIDAFKSALSIADEAFACSVLCTCESSGQTTKAEKIVECTNCGVSICLDCCDRCRTSSHDLHQVKLSSRDDYRVFERTLRSTFPSTLQLGKGCEDLLCDGEGLDSYSFKLQQVDRQRGHWLLIYAATEDHGNGRQVAELRVKLGRVSTLDSRNGLLATIKCFQPAIRDNPHRGPLLNAAKLEMRKDEDPEAPTPTWQIPLDAAKSTARICGSEECPSQRVQIGLNQNADKGIRSHKIQKRFIPSLKSRNDLIRYHPKWQKWPGKIEIKDADPSIAGTYMRMPCEQTIVHSALWRRRSQGLPDCFIYFRPCVSREQPDVAVIAHSPSYRDSTAVIAELLDWIPENSLEEKTHLTKVNLLQWKAEPKLLVDVSPESTSVTSPKAFAIATDEPQSLCTINGMTPESLAEVDGSGEGSFIIVDLVGSNGVQNTKRLKVLAAPPLLKHAAEGNLPLQFDGDWTSLPSQHDFGRNQTHVPNRPKETWVAVAGREIYERQSDDQANKTYYLALHERPRTWVVRLNRDAGSVDIQLNPFPTIHQAAKLLVEGLAAEDKVDGSFRLAELSSMEEPTAEPFKVPNSDRYTPTHVEGLCLPLYERQARALTRMLDIESGKVKFNEEEYAEEVLPGVGWSLIGRASRTSTLRGGVLGDAIGSGKTVITIALILADIENARKDRDVKRGISGATLIVVPPALIKQWDEEREKFTGKKLKCITIESTSALKRHSVKELCEADIVIVPVSILEEGASAKRPYTQHLCQMSGTRTPIPKAPTSSSHREAPTIEGTWIRNQASGPDSYVGNRGDQRKRDSQAYYSYCYETAVSNLRQKSFPPEKRGVPIEWFTWRRVVIDECHESLVTSMKERPSKEDSFKETARRGAREFLGVAQKDHRKRPLLATKASWGLTGTPLLETEARVTELANLLNGTYLTGAGHHWRRQESSSGRDMFLSMQEENRSRAYRRSVQDATHEYVEQACQRNRGSKLQVELIRKDVRANLSSEDGGRFLRELKRACDSEEDILSYAVQMDAIPDIENASRLLNITATADARARALIETIEATHLVDETAKIIVFADVQYGGHKAACEALEKAKKAFVSIDEAATSVETQNEKIAWFRHLDVTEEERARPRVLVLSFEQAAGHNLQTACNNVIMYEPKYSGSDAVADASVEEQAIGRVLRQGQVNDVNLTRIIVCGPEGEECADDWITNRNTDEEVLAAACSNFD